MANKERSSGKGETIGNNSNSNSTDDTKPKTKIKIAYLNARSVRNKVEDIVDFINHTKADLCALTETWLKEGPTDSVVRGALTPPGYKLQCIERKNKRGGGVAILYNGNLKGTVQATKKMLSFEMIEMLFTSRNDCIRLAVLYRPPSSSVSKFLEEFEAYVDSIMTASGKLVVVGDFNFHMDKSSDTDANKLKELLSSLNLKQHVTVGTHIQGRSLDLVITRNTDQLIDGKIEEHAPISDHKPLSFSCTVDKPVATKKTVKYRKLKDIDMNVFKEDLLKLPIFNLNTENVNDLVSTYNSGLSALIDKHAPILVKKIYERPQSPWYTEELAQAKRAKRQAERRWMKEQTTINLEILKHHTKNYKKLCKSSKIAYHQQQIEASKGDQKKLFKIANRLLYRQKDNSLPGEANNDKLANDFVTFFAEKISNITTKFNSINDMIQSDMPQNIRLLHDFNNVSEKDVKDIILGGNSKCCSLDPLPTSFVKDFIDILLPILHKIVNLSLYTNVMPDCLKTATVTPLLKKKSLDVNDFKNYRPVSNLPFLSKLIEKAVVRQLDAHMISNGLYPNMQSAYRKHHSTETALVKILDDLLNAVDNKKCCFLVLLDQSAAFDTVNQDLMLNRLQYMFGVTDNALAWLTTYFKHRHQSVCINGVSSKPKELITGFPQGSVLGPFMYPVYTSPLFQIAEKYGLSIHMYADDTQVYLSFSIDDKDVALEKLEDCLKEIRAWMFNNHLKLNDTKTEFLVIGNKNYRKQLDSVAHVKIGESCVDPVNSAKNIGAVLDNNLDLVKHVNNTCRTCYMYLHSISKIRSCLTQEATETLVNALITSRLDYCNAILYGLNEDLLKRLQLVQNNAARLVLKKKKHDHVTPLLKKLHWLPVKYRIQYKLNLLTFKCIHNIAPTYLSKLCISYTPVRSLRSSDKHLLVEKVGRTAKGDRAFSVAAPKLWNRLDPSIRALDNIVTFKSELKTHYFREAFK